MHRSGPGAGAGRDHGAEVPTLAGAARARGRTVRRGQPAVADAGLEGGGGHDRGSDADRSAEFDDERGQGAGSGDALNPQGPAVVFRDEAPHQHGLPIGLARSAAVMAVNATSPGNPPAFSSGSM